MSSGRTSTPASGVSEDPNKNVSNTAPKGVIILPKAVVAKETELRGEITIGVGSVLHPSCKILADNGPIVIGEGNIVEEKVVIRNRFPLSDNGEQKTLYIGSKNLFEPYSIIEGSVGNNNTVHCKGMERARLPMEMLLMKRFAARVCPATTISTGCVIGAMCQVDNDETLPPDTVIFGDSMERRTAETPQTPPFIDDHLEFLQKQLPTFHYILKSSL